MHAALTLAALAPTWHRHPLSRAILSLPILPPSLSPSSPRLFSARLVGLDTARLSATPEDAVVERQDASGQSEIDVEIIISEPPQESGGGGDGVGGDGVGGAGAGAGSSGGSSSGDGSGGAESEDEPGQKSAADSAVELVGLGAAQLSYEMLLPISRVQLIGDDAADEEDDSGLAVGTLLTLMALSVGLCVICTRYCCRRRSATAGRRKLLPANSSGHTQAGCGASLGARPHPRFRPSHPPRLHYPAGSGRAWARCRDESETVSLGAEGASLSAVEEAE